MSEKHELVETVRTVALPLVRAAGLEIWGVEIEQSGRTLVRVYVDGPAVFESTLPAGGTAEAVSATLDQCEDISRQLSLALDVEELFSNAWVLEVSSPGLSRVFFRLEQMRPYLGEVIEARLQTSWPQGPNGRKHWTGLLTAVDDSTCTLRPCVVSDEDEVVKVEEETVTLPWAQIRRAHLRTLFPKPQKPGKKKAYP